MIDEADRAILEGGGSGLVVGAGDPDGTPFATRGWAVWFPTAAMDRVRVVVSADPGFDSSLVGRTVAVTASDVRTLVTRQIKGPVLELGSASPDDLDAMSRQTPAFFQAIHETDGNPLSLLHRLLPVDVVAFEMRIDEAYDQTPGPGAGGALAGAK